MAVADITRTEKDLLMMTESEYVDHLMGHLVRTIGYQGVLSRLAQDARARAKKRNGLEVTHGLLDLAGKLDALLRDSLLLQDTFQPDRLQ